MTRPVITLRDWQIEISPEMVLKFQGADPELVRVRKPAAWNASERAVRQGSRLLQSMTIHRELDVVEVRHERLLLENNARLSGRGVSRMLRGASSVIICACTIGSGVEKAASDAFDDDPAFAFALDAYGSLAVDALASAFCTLVAQRAEAAGSRTTLPVNPGMEEWPVDTAQQQIFRLLDTSDAGITLTTSSQMVPKKSTSFVIGIGKEVTSEGRPCDFCTLRHTCLYQERYV